MRTTIDLPDGLLAQLRAIARDTDRTLSAVAADFVLRGMQPTRTAKIVKGKSGFPMFAATGQPITQEDVRALEDDE